MIIIAHSHKTHIVQPSQLSGNKGGGGGGSTLAEITQLPHGQPGLLIRPSGYSSLALWNLFCTGPGLKYY